MVIFSSLFCKIGISFLVWHFKYRNPHDLAAHSIKIQAATFILFGLNVYVSSVFTGLEDGLSSMIITASQSLIAPLLFVFLLPQLFGKEGVWYTVVAESVITAMLTVLLLLTRFKKGLLRNK